MSDTHSNGDSKPASPDSKPSLEQSQQERGMGPPDAPETSTEFSMRRDDSPPEQQQQQQSQSQSPILSQLGKRKESHDREPPSPDAKRRGSNAYLTLSERSSHEPLVDPARAAYAISQAANSSSGGPSSQWWANASERRDSTASMYSNRSLNSSAGYNSASTAATSYSNFPLSEKIGGPLAPQQPIAAFPMSYAWPPVPPQVQVTGAPPTGPNGNGNPPAAAVAAAAAAAAAGQSQGGMGAPPSRGPNPPSDSDRIVIDPALSSVRSGAQSPGGLYDPHGQGQGQGTESPMGGDERSHKAQSTFLSPPDDGTPNKDAPFSRSPELRVSHKLAERKRRKEMKDLFDELRDQLPADRGMKASKWEILSKAVDFITNMKQQHSELVRENDNLRREVDMARAAGVAQAQAQAQAQAYPAPPHFQHHPYMPAQYPPAGPYAQAPPPQQQQQGPPQQQQQQQQMPSQAQQPPPAASR